MRIYNRDEVCGFRFTREAWGGFSNFAPLAVPIAAGPWTFSTSEHLYQAAKFGADIDAALAATGERAVVEVSTRDPWWGARPAGDSYRGANVLGRLWMELRQQLRNGDPAAHSAVWAGRIRVGGLASAR